MIKRSQDASAVALADESGIPAISVGAQWVVDASGCNAEALTSLSQIDSVCRQVIDGLGLHVLGDGQSHRFGPPHGVTVLYLLSESHLACHTYPEHGVATFNLVCCRDHAVWPWQDELRKHLGATNVRVRKLPRGDWLRDQEVIG